MPIESRTRINRVRATTRKIHTSSERSFGGPPVLRTQFCGRSLRNRVLKPVTSLQQTLE